MLTIPMMATLWAGCGILDRGGRNQGAPFEYTDEITLDDFNVLPDDGSVYAFSRIDRPRDFFGLVDHGVDRAPIFNTQGDISGATYQIGRAGEGLRINQPLGTVLKYDFQPEVVGVRIQAVTGRGDLTVRFLDPEGTEFWSETQSFNAGGSSELKPVFFTYTAKNDETLGTVHWELRNGYATIARVELLVHETTPLVEPTLEAFVYSLGQLTECYDASIGLVAENCRDESRTRFRPDTSGLFALAVAIGEDLSMVEREVAVETVEAIGLALIDLPTDPAANLYPLHTDGKSLAADSHWSSLGTVVALESAILAHDILGLSATNLERALEDIEWAELTTNGNHGIWSGFDRFGKPETWKHEYFGGKMAMLQIAHALATRGDLAPMASEFTPTWDGAGYDNELGALLFPMDDDDYRGNDWVEWRDGQFWIQKDWTAKTPAGDLGLFGISEVEIPEPWNAAEGEPVVVSFGAGGHNQVGNDGYDTYGYTVLAPHYPAMVMAEYAEFITTFDGLLSLRVFSPLNAVESIAIGDDRKVFWNHHKRSWTLALQTLGLGRALSGSRYAPYMELRTSDKLRQGYEEFFPEREL